MLVGSWASLGRALWVAGALSLAACNGEPVSATPSGAGGAGGAEPTGGGGPGGAGGAAEGGGGQGGLADTGSLTVGLDHTPYESELSAKSLHVIMKVDGVVVGDTTEGGGVPAPLGLPREYSYPGLPDGAALETVIEVDYGNGLPPIQTIARSTIVAGRDLLQRVTLSQWYCAPCDPGLTCNWGRCMDPFVPPEALEDYTPDWASFSYCKPKNAGAPAATLGTGYVSFVPLNDSDVIDVYAGPQGGHHVYLSVRMSNLQQMSTLLLSAEVPDLSLQIGPLQSNTVFYDNPAGGYCEALGWLLQLDGQVTIDQLLGKTMVITGQVSDADGDSAEQTRTVVLSTDIQGF